MDASSNGFIFFSLGSNLRSDKLSAERRQIFLEVFAKLPYTVFWKWESDKLSNQPSNVIVGKWMPQRDILGMCNDLLRIHYKFFNIGSRGDGDFKDAAVSEKVIVWTRAASVSGT
ncbi:hypothetical protein PR048_015242 [Dryococelus australis]|uniref:Uncharacterized protein n=1 Tax=Dryococelus australis TaxID=614101 RepID=A0ABQ9HGJ6_9NEOP|nr:hypothetical protein PR048_015242 [Dryococelus australis]